MNPLASRRLLQPETNVSQVAGGGDAPPHLKNDSSSTAAFRRPFSPNTQLDSSMALTVIVVFTAFFFLGLFSVYIRRSTGAEASGSNQEGGLDPAALNSLPVVAYAKQQMMEECPICLSEFQEREAVRLIPYCGHVFHSSCVDTWLASHVTCPVCRSAQLFKKVEEG